MHHRYRIQLSCFAGLLLLAPWAQAYMGPGAGLGLLGSLLAISALGLATITGLLLYPLTLLRDRLRGKSSESEEQPSASSEEQGEPGPTQGN